ncbi:MAG: hypothetical protein KJO66_03255, partial [Gammaproteobacteria bacterium]|nr:hypothetical protein [Gammaproteobacteria bacterium]
DEPSPRTQLRGTGGMTGMPWQMSYAASADLENAELQTDVMRFMAILAFCLVAIFAIVQTLPLEARQQPDPVTAPAQVAAGPVSPSVPQPAAAAAVASPQRFVPKPVKRVVSVPANPQPKPVQLARVVTVPAPIPVVPRPRAVPEPLTVSRTTDPVPETPAESAMGLSLSFESDAVLRSLVERRLVGLYAIDGKAFYQMTVSAGRIRFRPGTAPAQYHEMVYQTVPREVARTFESQQPVSAHSVVWGVTLPAATTSQLRRFVQTSFTGGLVINADAQLALAGSS